MLERPRRNRKSAAIRGLVRETRLHVEQLIYPLFVHEDAENAPLESLPGQTRWSVEGLVGEVKRAHGLGINAVVLFPKVRIWSLILVVPVPLPAWLWLMAYFVLQFALLGGLATAGDEVAYLAHIGGFVAGVLLIKPFMVGRDRRPPAAPKPGTAY